MAKRPITIQLEPALIERIDGVRGTLARQAWIAMAIEAQLSGPVASAARALADAREDRERWARTADGRHLPGQSAPGGPNVENIRSSAQIKRDIQERPKKRK